MGFTDQNTASELWLTVVVSLQVCYKHFIMLYLHIVRHYFVFSGQLYKSLSVVFHHISITMFCHAIPIGSHHFVFFKNINCKIKPISTSGEVVCSEPLLEKQTKPSGVICMSDSVPF